MDLSAIATDNRTPACWEMPEMFSDPALDYNPNDEDYAHLDAITHTLYAAAKQVAEEACVNTCFGCPLMLQCEQKDIETHAGLESLAVHGVVGGRTEAERISNMNLTDSRIPESEVIMPTDRGSRNKIDDDTVLRLSNQNLSIEEIAREMQCSVRSVTRARSRLHITTRAAA